MATNEGIGEHVPCDAPGDRPRDPWQPIKMLYTAADCRRPQVATPGFNSLFLNFIVQLKDKITPFFVFTT